MGLSGVVNRAALWCRYFKNNPRFVFKIAANRTSVRLVAQMNFYGVRHMDKNGLIVVAGGGGFIGGALIADLRKQGYKRHQIC